jgi:hypothetical protein
MVRAFSLGVTMSKRTIFKQLAGSDEGSVNEGLLEKR